MIVGARRPGFTLVELLVVSVLTAVTLAGVYRTLIVQEKGYEAAGVMIGDQEAVRTAIGILESELREVSAIGDSIGGPDILVATTDSVVFRAQRKIGFVCRTGASGNSVVTWAFGEELEPGDQLLYFVDGDTLVASDDRWDTTSVKAVSTTTASDCESHWPGAQLRLVTVEDAADLTDVERGALTRAYDWITYGIYDFGTLGWGMGRRNSDGELSYLVGGLAPRGEGLILEYFDADGNPTTQVDRIARVRITVETEPRSSTKVRPSRTRSNLFLRNN